MHIKSADIICITQNIALLKLCMFMLVIQNFLKEAGAKFFVGSDGSAVVKAEGTLKGHEITKIQKFIKEHYLDMYKTWSEDSSNG